MTNEEFFDALDLDRPTLAAVRDAVEKGDMAGAQAAFVAHLKTRDSPRWHIDWRSRPANPDPSVPASGRRRIADDALEHRFTVCGLPHRFEGEIDWAFNPTADPAAGHALNHEWTWQFSRHPFWGSLGRAYWETGDERYVREFVAEMTHWVEQNPVPEPDADQGPYSRWRTIEAGIRMGGSWPDAFHLGLSSPSFSDGAVVTMVRSMTEHARYLKAHPTTRNWLTMEMSGLFTVGALFPEFREAREWRDTAARRMREELDEQVYPDGAQKELAPGYHWVALLNFRRILTLAQLNDYALPEGYKASLERMYDYILWMSTPDRALPPFNDSGHRAGYALGPLREAVEDFPAREEFRYVVTDGKEGTSPGRTSCAFPWAGHVVQRSGWDRDARYLAFDAGPFGAGHQHEDKLNFVLMAYGRELVVEGGAVSYTHLTLPTN